ncbi:MAG: hypothetical protein ETSY1_20040 [Candidatus Entotheonella factor]|uniref:Uncharacterized protein n=1 Tax=Entotheonella factor TaxID=1429438 RepID=W4LJM9_ENTF1|nr:hypothetical protein [Candidatus Entotheonella palauensis]ETW98129.1 MAG: hypothetical protein ETSY1_20040 [Candidatus Entotheonella factor]
MTTSSHASRHAFPDSLDAIEECYRRGWTDGLPVVPPTEDRVAAMLDYVGLAPDHVLGEVPVRRRSLTAEQAAANAVMAGCLPVYFPVILATLEVMFDHDPNCIHEVSAVTNSVGVLILVNGPIRHQLGLNCTDNLFSPGNRANMTIGRALRLILINVFEQRPGILDRGCMGSLTKFGVCIGEDEERSPWEPFHVSRGYAPEDSTVTVATIQDPEMLGNRYGQTGESILEATADAMASHGLAVHFNETQWLWVVGHWHAEMLGRQGWDRARMQQYIHERAWRPRSAYKRLGAIRGDLTPEDDDARVYAAPKPEDILIMKAGGDSGIYSELIKIYYGLLAHTTRIRIPDTA